MKKLLLASIAALSVLSASAAVPAAAADITVVPANNHYNQFNHISLMGRITSADPASFWLFTHKLEGDSLVYLNSPGGDCEAAIHIGSIIRKMQWTTNVIARNVCDSACAIIWLSGVHRRLGPNVPIGIHSAAMPNDLTKRNDAGNELIALYLRSIDIPEVIIQRLFKTPPTSMDYMYRSEALSLGLLSNPPPPSEWPGPNNRWSPQFIPPAGKMFPWMKIQETP